MRVDIANYRNVSSAGSASSLLAKWRVGAVLQATAVRDVSGQLWLDIGNTRYAARVASGEGAPPDGERLQVRVLRNSPVLALETVPQPDAEFSADEAATADVLRRFVPRQASPAPLLANLGWIAQGKSERSGLPKAVLQAANNLWQALPEAESLTKPESLETSIARSGAFLEANLATSSPRAAGPLLATDLKALMLVLDKTLKEHGARPAAARGDAVMSAPLPVAGGTLSALSSAPATLALADAASQQMNELSRQTDGALARLTTAQIANSSQDGAANSMLIELPVRHEDRASILRLRIDRDNSRRSEYAESSWTVEAAMDLGAVGALHARVTLSGHRIGVQLRAESASVVEALSIHAAELEALLRDAGLDVDRVVCLHGMPVGDAGARAARLLDVRA
jgi:hypothetical protein